MLNIDSHSMFKMKSKLSEISQKFLFGSSFFTLISNFYVCRFNIQASEDGS